MNHTNNGQQYLLQETNYEAEVKKVYPMAVTSFQRDYSSGLNYYVIMVEDVSISDNLTVKGWAWQSAYEKLKQQNKL